MIIKRPRILLVEDDTTLLEMYKERFGRERFEVITATDGEEALDIALRRIPNMILLDLMLPKKGGLGVLEVLKSRPETRDIPVVILTAYPREEYKEKGLREGAVLFLSKSETMPGQVVERVKEALKKGNE